MSTPVINESQLRYPHERVLFVATVILNLAIPVLAIILVVIGSDWLSTHPFFAEKIKKILVAAIIGILSPLALGFIRNTRREYIRGNSLRLSKDQLPQIYEIFEKHCDKL